MKVFIVASDRLTENLWKSRGWDIAKDEEEADIIQFTGGEDVSPFLYDQPPHPTTYFSPYRDEREKGIFERNLFGKGVPMVGICRGGQFLNVMSGGSMIQDVTGHTRSHSMYDAVWDTGMTVTSTHHQMMSPGSGGAVLAYASQEGEKTVYDERTREFETFRNIGGFDPEVVFYPLTRSLCFQPHPEYEPDSKMASYFFDLIDKFLLEK